MKIPPIVVIPNTAISIHIAEDRIVLSQDTGRACSLSWHHVHTDDVLAAIRKAEHQIRHGKGTGGA